MSTGGLSEARLGRMHGVMAGHVERGRVPGLVTLVSRRSEVHVDAIGTKAVGGRDPMGRDTIFRITSMTKPITAAATMILVEECKLRLDEPVDRLPPELAERKVLKLTFRLGFGLIMGPPDVYPIQKAVSGLGIVGFGPPNQSPPHDPDERIRRLATLPFMHQPGEKWMYNTGSYVLGVLIERASGRPLETFFRERIFEPLGMKDTGFSVSAAKLHRLAPSYWPDAETGALELHDGVEDSQWSRPPAFPDGGAGLVSTIADYVAAVPGRFGWDGGYGTSWASDPTEDMVAILMTQRATFPLSSGIYLDFWTSAYQAIDD